MLHNLEAEQAVIASVLMDNDCLDSFTRLDKTHFYSPAHQMIFTAICELTTKNQPVDLVTLSERLQAVGKLEAVGGNDYLTSLMDLLPSTVNFRHYVEILKKQATLRRLAGAAAAITKEVNQAEDDQTVLQYAEKLILDISKENEKKELTKLAAELPTVLDNFDRVAKDPTVLQGLKTGYPGFDWATNGLHAGNLIILGARPAVGKSSLGLNICLNAALKSKAKVAIFSMEMSKSEVATRALCSVAKVSARRATRGDLRPDEWAKLWEANEKLQKANVYIDDTSGSSMTPEEIIRKCMRLKREHGLDLVMVDYLGLMGTSKGANKNDNRQVQVANNCWLMKSLAKDLEIPVLLLAQLNREIDDQARKGKNSEPVLSDLRESGAIEQHADIVVFIHKPKTATEGVEENPAQPRSNDYEAKIIIAKNRSGPTKAFNLQFIGEWTTFVNPDSVEPASALASSGAAVAGGTAGAAGENNATNLAGAKVPNATSLPKIVPLADSAISDVF